MKQPVEPSKEDCCNSGCNPCIYDVYEKQLRLYEKFKKEGEAPVQRENGISQLEYTRFSVSSVISVSDSHKLITFVRLDQEKNILPKIWWNPGDHFLLKYCSHSDTNSCTRAYTPIKLKINTQEEFDFSIILKQYDSGLVSKYLYSLKKGDETLWRGPYGSYKIIPNKYNRIIMIAQGTGIAPFISIIDSILYNEDDMTKLILFYCCPSEDIILFRSELYNYRSFWNFTYEIFLSSFQKNGTYKYQEPINNWKLKYDDLAVLKPLLINDQFLLCGSTNFMKEYECFLLSGGVLSNSIILF